MLNFIIIFGYIDKEVVNKIGECVAKVSVSGKNISGSTVLNLKFSQKYCSYFKTLKSLSTNINDNFTIIILIYYFSLRVIVWPFHQLHMQLWTSHKEQIVNNNKLKFSAQIFNQERNAIVEKDKHCQHLRRLCQEVIILLLFKNRYLSR